MWYIYITIYIIIGLFVGIWFLVKSIQLGIAQKYTKGQVLVGNFLVFLFWPLFIVYLILQFIYETYKLL